MFIFSLPVVRDLAKPLLLFAEYAFGINPHLLHLAYLCVI